MNILLINPPALNDIKIVREGRCMQREEAWGTSWSPLSLATLSAVLKEEGFTTRIEDCTKKEIDKSGLKTILEEFQPKLVIINTATPSINNDLSCASIINEVNPEIKSAFFGIHVTALDQECMESHPDVDCIVRGEPEDTTKDLAMAIRDRRSLDSVDGITWRNENRIVKNKDRAYIRELDALPFPDWDGVNIDLYTMPITGEIFLLVMASRGCPYPCTFCAATTMYGKPHRFRSPKRIVDEMAHAEKSLGVHSFLFWSEEFTSSKDHVYAVCDEIIERGLKYKWVANSRVDSVDLPLLKRMKEAGCWMIGYGIESGNQDILDAIKKHTTLSQIETAVDLTRQAGILSTAHVIIGFPGETKQHLMNTSRFINRIGVDFLQLYCCVPFPGSVLYKQAKANKWITTDNWELFEQNHCVISTPQLSAEEVMRLRKVIFRRFYMNPKRALGVLKNIRSPRDLKTFLIMLKNFHKWI